MRRRSFWWKLSAMAGFCLIAAAAHAQQDLVQATIEVDTVKPHPAAVMHNNFAFSRDRFVLEDQPILKLIAFAYSVNPKQVVGAPSWLDNKHWDMNGTTNLTEDATFPQEQQLIRQLLKERFGLRFHHEQREMSAYALRVVKEQPILAAAANPGAQPVEHTEGREEQRTENYRSSTIGYFLTIRQLFMDRPLVDQTELKGIYDFKLTYSYGDAPNTDADAPPPMFTAIKEQLGLKFEPVKTAVQVMVVDHIEQPSAN
jgi:uncharacterized protein (TIGR03435 family)